MQTLNAAQAARLRRFMQLGLVREWQPQNATDGRLVAVLIVTGAGESSSIDAWQLNAYLDGLAHGSWIGQAQ
jgi:hypothetical protein